MARADTCHDAGSRLQDGVHVGTDVVGDEGQVETLEEARQDEHSLDLRQAAPMQVRGQAPTGR